MSVNDIPYICIDLYWYPSATVNSLTNKLDQREFWTKTDDLVILCIGINDLAREGVDQVFNKLCGLLKRIVPVTKIFTACTIEYRLYQMGNRFGVDIETFRYKIIKINRKIRRFVTNIRCGHGKDSFYA